MYVGSFPEMFNDLSIFLHSGACPSLENLLNLYLLLRVAKGAFRKYYKYVQKFYCNSPDDFWAT